jgi:SAM-dependent methyltransferase
MKRRALLLGALALPWGAQLRAQMPAYTWDDGTVPFVVTPMPLVERMLRMAELAPEDFVIDLGSGDGRIVIEAARRGARGLGVEIDPSLVAAAGENARRAGVGDRVRFEARDLFETDLSAATVVTIYLLPELNRKLVPRLLALRPGTRIVSHDAGLGDWPFDERLEMRLADRPVGTGHSRIELWIVPARAAGTWSSELPAHGGRWDFRVRQRYQLLDVEARAQGSELVVAEAGLRGRQITLVVNGVIGRRAWRHVFTGTVEDRRITGELLVADGNQQRTHPWSAVREG